jgi:hypothetical protein
VNVGATPFGNVASGALASSFGAPFAMATGAAAALVSVLLASGWLYLHRGSADLSLSPSMDLTLPMRGEHETSSTDRDAVPAERQVASPSRRAS